MGLKMRFHLVDRVEEICYGKYVIGVKCITLADDVFNEHFPGYPIFPGSLSLEGLAQLGGSFFEIMMNEKGLPLKRAVLTIINRMKFRKPAGPGDKLLYRAEIITMRDDYGVAKLKAELDGEICATGEFTFSFIDIQNDTLQKSREEIYRICMQNARVVKDEGGV
jgi:3-hydroxyacyl-[acyl-carrier-protein] dehydratase